MINRMRYLNRINKLNKRYFSNSINTCSDSIGIQQSNNNINSNQPTIDDLNVLKPTKNFKRVNDKKDFYDKSYKRISNAFTKDQLKYLNNQLNLTTAFKLTKQNLIDNILKHWGIYNEQYLNAIKKQKAIKNSQITDTIPLNDHALFLLLGRNGQGQYQNLMKDFNLKVNIKKSLPNLSLILSGSQQSINDGKEFIKNFESKIIQRVLKFKKFEEFMSSKILLLKVSKLSLVYLDPSSIKSNSIVAYGLNDDSINLAERLITQHIRYLSNHFDSYNNSLITVCDNLQSPLSLMPFEFRDEKPWNLLSPFYRLNEIKYSISNPVDDNSNNDVVNYDKFFNQIPLFANNNSDKLSIKLGYYVYNDLDDNDTSFNSTSIVNLDELKNKKSPHFIPSVNPASLTIPLSFDQSTSNIHRISYVNLLNNNSFTLDIQNGTTENDTQNIENSLGSENNIENNNVNEKEVENGFIENNEKETESKNKNLDNEDIKNEANENDIKENNTYKLNNIASEGLQLPNCAIDALIEKQSEVANPEVKFKLIEALQPWLRNP